MNPFDRDVIGYKYGRNEGRGGGICFQESSGGMGWLVVGAIH